MVWDFEYFNRDQVGEIASFGKALPCLVGANAIVDSDFLTVIEAAERGVFEAMCEAARIFMTGVKGVPRNYHLAKRYLDAILVVNETTNCPVVLVESYRNYGLLERNFGNLEEAKRYFIKAIQIMANNISPEDWDFDIPYYLHQVTFPDRESEVY